MYKWLDWIGMYGPFLMFGIGITQLYLREKYLFWFVVCILLNEYIIVFLKQSIREPRPVELTAEVSRPEYYGMPSGHAQHAFFILVYLFLVEPSWVILCICVVIACITLIERYIHKRHTAQQLFVGSILGVGYAYMCVRMVSWLTQDNFYNSLHYSLYNEKCL